MLYLDVVNEVMFYLVIITDDGNEFLPGDNTDFLIELSKLK